MNTKQITLALLAAATAGALSSAYADDNSNVVIYGYVRAGVEMLNGNANSDWGFATANGAAAHNDKVATNNVSGRAEINFKGTENLGNGLASVWQVQNEFTPTGSGTVDDEHTYRAGYFASDDSFVGLKSASMGELRLGRGTGNFEDGKYENSVIVGPDQVQGWFGDAEGLNMVRYDLPTFGGVNSSLQYATEENKTRTYNGTQHVSVNASYDVGSWGISAAYCSTSNAMVTDGTQAAVQASGQTTAFAWASNQGATGTLGQAHLTAMVKPTDSVQLVVELQHNTLAGDSQNQGAVYAYYTLGATQLGLQGGVQTYGGDKPANLDSGKFVDAFLHYNFSKKTMGYIEVLDSKNGAAGEGSRVMSTIGLSTNF
jgi:predicted porin